MIGFTCCFNVATYVLLGCPCRFAQLIEYTGVTGPYVSLEMHSMLRVAVWPIYKVSSSTHGSCEGIISIVSQPAVHGTPLGSMSICRLQTKKCCGRKVARDNRILLPCSSQTCNRHCIIEGATRAKCGLLIVRSFFFCTKECD
ncbi:hypothetical protein GQ55_3G470400 [Panicum hallii var. hallii]|uniref:Secreted protein n=1 Tax=Panicum hallii var. hallii TaxID=1504633 RepID=A0A2T7EJ68_9POAL|nr:hypothetical protein GQ55_3G470400 [Panicum hallii var. hallii]